MITKQLVFSLSAFFLVSAVHCTQRSRRCGCSPLKKHSLPFNAPCGFFAPPVRVPDRLMGSMGLIPAPPVALISPPGSAIALIPPPPVTACLPNIVAQQVCSPPIVLEHPESVSCYPPELHHVAQHTLPYTVDYINAPLISHFHQHSPINYKHAPMVLNHHEPEVVVDFFDPVVKPCGACEIFPVLDHHDFAPPLGKGFVYSDHSPVLAHQVSPGYDLHPKLGLGEELCCSAPIKELFKPAVVESALVPFWDS